MEIFKEIGREKGRRRFECIEKICMIKNMEQDNMKSEKTLVLIKPDGVQRGLIGEIVKRYERTGLKLIGLKMLVATPEMVEPHVIEPMIYKILFTT
jgi:hypothetical protein